MPAFANPDALALADESGEQRSAQELARLIEKLRWIGANDEAEKLQRRLRIAHIEECVLTAPRETD